MFRRRTRPAVATIALLVLVLSAPSTTAAEFTIFEDPRRSLISTDVEANALRGGYLATALSYDYRDGSQRYIARRVEQGKLRPILGPVHIVFDDVFSTTNLSYSSRRDVYLTMFSARTKTPPRVYAIFGRILAADGRPLGQPFRISPEDGCWGMWPYGAAYSPVTNRWLVTWAGSGVRQRCERVRARFVSASGVPGHEVFVSRNGHLRAGGDVAYSAATSEFLVAWADSPHSVYGRIIREQAGRNSRRLLLARSREDCVFHPKAAGSSHTGGWLVMWQNRCGDVVDGTLESRTVESRGTLRRTRSFRQGPVVHPGNIAFSENTGRYLVVWEEVADLENVGAQRDVYFQWFRRGGRPRGAARETVPTRSVWESEDSPRAACSTRTSECLLIWYGNGEIFGEFVSPR